jgi:hypothetical protein
MRHVSSTRGPISHHGQNWDAMCVHARADIRFVAATATLRRRPIEMVAVASDACRVGQAKPLEIASQCSDEGSIEQKTMLDGAAVSMYIRNLWQSATPRHRRGPGGRVNTLGTPEPSALGPTFGRFCRSFPYKYLSYPICSISLCKPPLLNPISPHSTRRIPSSCRAKSNTLWECQLVTTFPFRKLASFSGHQASNRQTTISMPSVVPSSWGNDAAGWACHCWAWARWTGCSAEAVYVNTLPNMC